MTMIMAKYVMIIFKIAKGLNTKRSHFSFINIKIKEIFLPQHCKPLNIRCGSYVSICLAEIPQRERYNLILYILMLRLDLEMTKIRVFIKDMEWATSEKQNHFSQLTTQPWGLSEECDCVTLGESPHSWDVRQTRDEWWEPVHMHGKYRNTF